MRIEQLGVAVLSVLLLLSSSADANEEEVRSHVDAYFRDFNEIRTPQYLAESYLSAPLTIVSSRGVRNLSSMEEVRDWLSQTQETLKETGWIRSELLESRVCMVADNVAVFSMKLARRGKEGSTEIGATYTLFKFDGWRIATILIADPPKLLSCDPPSRHR